MASSRLRSAVLVLVCGVCVCVSEATLQRDYGVKLCGREFIRAVIFTCGGSRWKRSVDQEQEGMDKNSPFLLTSFQNPSDRNAEMVWTQNHKQPSSLSELLQVLGEQTESGQEERNLPEDVLRDTGVRTWVDMLFPSGHFRKMDISWPGPDRKKRNFSLGLAGMCCNQGCTKHDIGRLC